MAHAVPRPALTGAASVMVAAAWQGTAADASDDVLLQVWAAARPECVQGWIAHAYGERLPAGLRAEARDRQSRWTSNLDEVAAILRAAHVEAVLIKSGLEGRRQPDSQPIPASEYGDIDLVVGGDGWPRAVRALRSWGQVEPVSWLEPHKLHLRPPCGPAVHLHRDAEWFGIRAVDFNVLREASRPMENGLLLPSCEAGIVLLMGHAIFQTLRLGLADIVELRRLSGLVPQADAPRLAGECGWGRAFRFAMSRAKVAMTALDAGDVSVLPASLAGLHSLIDGWRHAAYLARTGSAAGALREAVLRPCLLAAKSRRRPTAA